MYSLNYIFFCTDSLLSSEPNFFILHFLIERYHINLCKSVCPFLYAYRKHLIRCHKDHAIVTNDQDLTKRILECQDCDYVTYCRSDMKYHAIHKHQKVARASDVHSCDHPGCAYVTAKKSKDWNFGVGLCGDHFCLEFQLNFSFNHTSFHFNKA